MGLSRPHMPTVLDDHVTDMILGIMIPGTFLTLLLLSGYAYAAWRPVSRSSLNRVSFRLLVYALIANIIYSVAFIKGVVFSGPDTRCGHVIFLVNFGQIFSAGMFFCIALNLQLVLVHHVHGQRMEKYYVFVALLLGGTLSTTGWAAGQFGWNAQSHTCWFRNPDPRALTRWVVGLQTCWVLFMALGEVAAFTAIFGCIYSYELKARRCREEFEQRSTFQDCQIWPKSPFTKHRNMILRVGLYPLMSCLMNFTTCILDLYQIKSAEGSGYLTEIAWRLNILGPPRLSLSSLYMLTGDRLDLLMYSVRPLFYGMLAATDPAFMRAVRLLRRPGQTESTTPCTGPAVSLEFAPQYASEGTDHDFGVQTAERKTSQPDVEAGGSGAGAGDVDSHVHLPTHTAKRTPPTPGGLELHRRRGSETFDVASHI
ncbi:hypothetical protein B0H15DRAFT_993450 [Mycena belliarum]|uniref:Uncharacterized protein n=1 Tax=Mycena belliarum TaxID=1033014 RepID=A0AAD6TZ41_9AGAR|nr:hypothetical protein B0H15DRAFT_993450 [Mycena belliae]